jgi:hypothetical protein
MKFQLPLVEKFIEQIGCTAPITYIVPNKLQAVRFFSMYSLEILTISSI